MRNIFKTFKENKRLLEENKLLKAQNDALAEFRKSFDNYYNDISGVRVITRNYDKKLVLTGSYSLDRNGMYCPTDVCKDIYGRHSYVTESDPDKDITILQMVICGEREVMAELVYTKDYNEVQK